MPNWTVWTIVALAALAVAGGLALAVAVARLRRTDRRVRANLAGFDHELSRRAHASINLVTAVRSVAEHERGVIAEADAAREEALAAVRSDSVARRLAAESRLDRSIADLLAIAEAYPDLTDSESFRAYRQQVAESDHGGPDVRTAWEQEARSLDTLLGTSPWRQLAPLAGVRPRAEREPGG